MFSMCLDDTWADVLAVFGKDIYELDGGTAVKLAERVMDCAPRDPEGRPASAVYSWYERWKKEHPAEAVRMEDEKYTLMDDDAIEEAGGEVG